MLPAIWCPASVVVPKRAMNSAMKVYDVTSIRYDSPIGMPSRNCAACRRQTGQQKCAKIANGRNTSTRVSSTMPTVASAQLIAVLASAQPGPPSAGTPHPPKINHVLSGNFSNSAPTCRIITSRGLPTALLSEL